MLTVKAIANVPELLFFARADVNIRSTRCVVAHMLHKFGSVADDMNRENRRIRFERDLCARCVV